MTKIEVLNELDQSGFLVKAIKCGLITPTLFLWRDVALKYDIHIKMKKNKGDAEFLTAQEFRMSERNVRRIVRELKK
jgi:hypothetical protein